MSPSPKSVILDLLQSMRGRALAVRALVEAGALFGLPENGMRVALARLVARGLVARQGPGSYRLAPGAQPISRRVGGWTAADQRGSRWDGGWIGALTPGRDRAARRSDARALAFLGFERLAPSLWVRPDNLRGGVTAVREALFELGLDPQVSVLRLSELDARTETRARKLWDADALVSAQRQAREALERSAGKLIRLTAAEAMAETFLVGGRAIRQIALDPLLPEEIAPERERRALVAAMREYDKVGRACWREFMRAHDAPTAQAPAHGAALGRHS
ncbi:MAG TPA: PaaX family transcriptional regulator [Myxococcota bacterium]|nr:PaaX family transcriptional regulator [Myxococcota bacterium]